MNDRSQPMMKNPIDIHIGSRLRLRRRTLGLSQNSLARRLQITCQQVCKYECGENRISASKLFLASDILACPISFFFEGLAAATNGHKAANVEQADQIVSHFLSRPDGLQLAGAFPRIRSPRLRRQVMRLVNCLADENEQPALTPPPAAVALAVARRAPRRRRRPAAP